MATDVERLAISLEARVNQFERQLKKAERDLDGSANNIESRAARMSRKVEREFDGMGSKMSGAFRAGAGSIAAVIATAVGSVSLTSLADQFTRLENSLKVTGLEGSALSGTLNELFDIAMRNGVAVEPLVNLYSGLSQAQKELNTNSSEMTQFTEATALALRVAGTDAQTASGALLQLRQAMGSGRVSAEEYNSILEGARPILQAAAAGMVEAGGSVAKLTQLVKNGEVSSQAFYRAILAGQPLLQDMADRTAPTVAQGMTRISTAMLKLSGDLEQVTGAAAALGQGLDALSEWIAKSGAPQIVEFTRDMVAFGKAISDVVSLIPQIGNANPNMGLFDVIRNAGSRVRNSPTGPGGYIAPNTEENSGTRTARPINAIRASAFPVGGAGNGSGGGSASERLNAYDREVQAIQRRTAALKVDTQTLALSTFEVTRAKAEHDLLTAAETAKIPITDTLRSRVRGLANAYAVQTETLEAARQKQQSFNDAQRFAGQAIGSFLSDIVSGGKNAQEALMNLLKRLSEVMLQAALLGDGPLGGIFGMRGQGGAPGGLIGALFGSFGGALATGGPVTAGTSYLVGERGPELFTARSSGMIVPNNAIGAGAGGGGRSEVVISLSPGLTSAIVNQAEARVSVKIRQLEAQVPSMAQAAVAQGRIDRKPGLV
jgi:tape measure domain-containing protein